MGNICKHTVLLREDNYQEITIKNFECTRKLIDGMEVDEIIGRGGFAYVKRVQRKKDAKEQRDPTFYAMKTMDKLGVQAQKNILPTMNEMFILRDIDHPFLIEMKWAFQDKQSLYLIMKELKGKDLRFHIVNYKLKEDKALKQKYAELDYQRKNIHLPDNNNNNNNIPSAQKQNEEKNNQIKNEKPPIEYELSSFTENQTRFLIAQVCLALNYLHHKQIIHRDIKPENILFEEDGYLRITDLGIAMKYRPNNSTDTSGTPGYMAPEVLCRQNHKQ